MLLKPCVVWGEGGEGITLERLVRVVGIHGRASEMVLIYMLKR